MTMRIRDCIMIKNCVSEFFLDRETETSSLRVLIEANVRVCTVVFVCCSVF